MKIELNFLKFYFYEVNVSRLHYHNNNNNNAILTTEIGLQNFDKNIKKKNHGNYV